MTSILSRLRETSATPRYAVGSLSAILDLEPETGGEDAYAKVGRKPASRKLGGLVTVSRLVVRKSKTDEMDPYRDLVSLVSLFSAS